MGWGTCPCVTATIVITGASYSLEDGTRCLPMTVASANIDVNQLVNNLQTLTSELTALHGELYCLAMQSEDSAGPTAPAAELAVELLPAWKGRFHTIRMPVW